MILIRYRGGLGNQMFQYAFQLAVQQKYTDVSVLADLSHYTLNHEHNGFELQKYFGIELQTAKENEIRKISPYYVPSSLACKLPVAARNFLTEHYQYRYAEKEKKKTQSTDICIILCFHRRLMLRIPALPQQGLYILLPLMKSVYVS